MRYYNFAIKKSWPQPTQEVHYIGVNAIDFGQMAQPSSIGELFVQQPLVLRCC